MLLPANIPRAGPNDQNASILTLRNQRSDETDEGSSKIRIFTLWNRGESKLQILTGPRSRRIRYASRVTLVKELYLSKP